MNIIKPGFESYSQQTRVFLKRLSVDIFGGLQKNNNENKDWYKKKLQYCTDLKCTNSVRFYHCKFCKYTFKQ